MFNDIGGEAFPLRPWRMQEPRALESFFPVLGWLRAQVRQIHVHVAIGAGVVVNLESDLIVIPGERARGRELAPLVIVWQILPLSAEHLLLILLQAPNPELIEATPATPRATDPYGGIERVAWLHGPGDILVNRG